MKILTFDIGTGTKDVLLFDSERRLENCVKMVVTSPTVVNADRIAALDTDIFLDGHVVGGGPLVHACMKHKARGHRVVFSPEAAFAVRNDRARVEEMGFEVGPNPGLPAIELDELDIERYLGFFQGLGEDPSKIEAIGLAVQDHGRAGEGEADRTFRFNNFLEYLERDPTLDGFIHTDENLPDYFLRMRCARDTLRRRVPGMRTIFLDTCIAAIRGCLASDPVHAGPVMVLNCGNSHSMAAIVRGKRILALFEHHTKILKRDPSKYVHYLTGLADGTIDRVKVMEDEGEGSFVFETVGPAAIEAFLVTGPRRSLIDGLAFPFPVQPRVAAPGGDMMMTGTVGLVDAYRAARGLDFKIG